MMRRMISMMSGRAKKKFECIGCHVDFEDDTYLGADDEFVCTNCAEFQKICWFCRKIYVDKDHVALKAGVDCCEDCNKYYETLVYDATRQEQKDGFRDESVAGQIAATRAQYASLPPPPATPSVTYEKSDWEKAKDIEKETGVECRIEGGRKIYINNLSSKKVDKCGACKHDKPVLNINEDLWRKMQKLLRDCSHEWLGYLMGTAYDDESYDVLDIVIPKQKVSSCACENLEAPPKDHIGIVHSHHTMFAEHSGTDTNGIDQQNMISLVLSTKGYTATAKVELECGRFMVLPAKVNIVRPEPDDSGLKSWVEECVGKMERDGYGNQATVYDYHDDVGRYAYYQDGLQRGKGGRKRGGKGKGKGKPPEPVAGAVYTPQNSAAKSKYRDEDYIIRPGTQEWDYMDGFGG